ncbi:hypothetical protein L596_022665 [Steinernema carpocapsae]|uniref:Uncharacterized protein n=1 Tax=Steinernema carpocapsae TaxID=34508 RepID=A0A4U5MMG8_STECR|nr:hypothetical protein L596_022665 [Steinernema carpocapsae]
MKQYFVVGGQVTDEFAVVVIDDLLPSWQRRFSRATHTMIVKTADKDSGAHIEEMVSGEVSGSGPPGYD